MQPGYPTAWPKMDEWAPDWGRVRNRDWHLRKAKYRRKLPL